jgi:hypothetical protein
MIEQYELAKKYIPSLTLKVEPYRSTVYVDGVMVFNCEGAAHSHSTEAYLGGVIQGFYQGLKQDRFTYKK